MSEAGWGTDKPTEPGWYWWRDAAFAPCVVEVRDRGDGLRYLCAFGWILVSQQGGEWLGPITPDA